LEERKVAREAGRRRFHKEGLITLKDRGCVVVEWWRSRPLDQGPGFKRQPGQKFETRFLLHSHPRGGEGVSPVQGEAIRRRYIKPEYLSLSNIYRTAHFKSHLLNFAGW